MLFALYPHCLTVDRAITFTVVGMPRNLSTGSCQDCGFDQFPLHW